MKQSCQRTDLHDREPARRIPAKKFYRIRSKSDKRFSRWYDITYQRNDMACQLSAKNALWLRLLIPAPVAARNDSHQSLPRWQQPGIQSALMECVPKYPTRKRRFLVSKFVLICLYIGDNRKYWWLRSKEWPSFHYTSVISKGAFRLLVE